MADSESWMWIALLGGSIFGGLFVFVGVMHFRDEKTMQLYDRLLGKWAGIPGEYLRTGFGILYMVVGLGMFFGLWAEHFKSIQGEDLHIVQALLICAPIGMMAVASYGLWFYYEVDEKCHRTSIGIIVAMAILLHARYQITPWSSIPNQQRPLIRIFIVLCVLALLLAFCLKIAKGAALGQVKAEKMSMEMHTAAQEIDRAMQSLQHW
eukprot:TRINITY_DN15091_c1_g1_i1.p1 TRINITY_DN15091_c1_g1~~TRINITY_DN15091_c1_g1_i1.p1  ORF type:complete len:208 (-),score=22.67 TRINITY_DN15091_c1_g1_i1:241-864(-)